MCVCVCVCVCVRARALLWDPALTAGKTTLSSGPPAAPEDARALREAKGGPPRVPVC